MMATIYCTNTTPQDRITVNGSDIEVVCSNFGDRILLVVSQLNKFGTLVMAALLCSESDVCYVVCSWR